MNQFRCHPIPRRSCRAKPYDVVARVEPHASQHDWVLQCLLDQAPADALLVLRDGRLVGEEALDAELSLGLVEDARLAGVGREPEEHGESHADSDDALKATESATAVSFLCKPMLLG